MNELITALMSLSLLLSSVPVQAEELSPMDVWLNELSWCESRDNPNALNPKDPVTRSVGLYQFKDATFLRYAKKYNFYGDVSDKEILSNIWDPKAQKVMTRNMIQEDWNNYKQWGCVVSGKVRKPPKG